MYLNIYSDFDLEGTKDAAGITMSWMVQQALPRIQIAFFDGSPSIWVEFIVKFRDLVHQQKYLTNIQRMTYLLQHLHVEAKRSVQGFTNDKAGYIAALQRLKYIFEQKSKVAQAQLWNVIHGKSISNDDAVGLSEFYYTISDCLVNLHQLNYQSDLYSSNVLRQAVRRLPTKLHGKWAEHCLKLRQKTEPNLIHLESWLQDRVLAMKEAHLSNYP